MSTTHTSADRASTTTSIERLSRAERAVARIVSNVIAEENCREAEWRALRELAKGSGRTMGELSTLLQMPAASLTRLIDDLSERGLCYRRPSVEDARRVMVHVSRTGDQRLQRLEALILAQRERIENVLAEHGVRVD